jgi:hypothetical protein
MPSTAEYALFSARAYEMIPRDQFRQRIGDRWRLFPVHSRLRENPVTGFRARVYHNEAMRELVIAFAGTHLNDRGDWGAIWAMTNRHEPPQFNDALALYRDVQRQLEKKIPRPTYPSPATPSAVRWRSTWPSPPGAAAPKPSGRRAS